VTEERLRAVEELGETLRSLNRAAVSTEVDTDRLLRVADDLRALVPHLASETRSHNERPSTDPRGSGRRTYNPVTGLGSPIAPPLRVEVGDGVAVGTCSLSLVHEGPRGYAHGGITAMLLDQVLGHVHAVFRRRAGMTVELSVRYRRPVPLETPLQVTARPVERRDEARTDLHATLTTVAAPGTVLAEASGTFMVPGVEQVERIFGQKAT
jgi:acyl-coenzyme A thioesterase PaaI-like protein